MTFPFSSRTQAGCPFYVCPFPCTSSVLPHYIVVAIPHIGGEPLLTRHHCHFFIMWSSGFIEFYID